MVSSQDVRASQEHQVRILSAGREGDDLPCTFLSPQSYHGWKQEDQPCTVLH